MSDLLRDVLEVEEDVASEVIESPFGVVKDVELDNVVESADSAARLLSLFRSKSKSS